MGQEDKEERFSFMSEVKESELFFIRDKRSVVGNSVMWWARNSAGYTVDIRGAQIFTKEEAEKICRGCRPTDVAYPVDRIMALTQLHIDIQDLNAGRCRPHTLDRLVPKKDGTES
jgi:hypothetical protein